MNFRGTANQIQIILNAFILVYGKNAKMIDVIERVKKCN